MNNRNVIILILALFLTSTAVSFTSCSKDEVQFNESNKDERNHIRKGNSLYEDGNYADAEVEYGKALEANPNSAKAAYNMAMAIIRQVPPGDTTGIITRADSLLSFAAQVTPDKNLKSMAFYNRGNIAYSCQNYAGAIECYKQALRFVPNDEDARYNLRMAQLKLKDQQDQRDKNQDKDQDQNQDQNKDQNQDQKQDQDKKDQDKKDQDNQQQDKQNQGQGQQQQANATKMDERSMQQVLKTMQDKEKATQQKMYQMQERQQRGERQATRNKW
ncbi:MAG: tetratricopeptide repeat protein [Muribaculaceae bacterium]|nr:tetratricopeptide repeat protein [Muribaculaceae bacterium]